jgi:hypothetical protein
MPLQSPQRSTWNEQRGGSAVRAQGFGVAATGGAQFVMGAPDFDHPAQEVAHIRGPTLAPPAMGARRYG